jgi:hypothetical protein
MRGDKKTKQECPVVLSVIETNMAAVTETVIQRNDVRTSERERSNDIYMRAREIYFRARRHRPVRAASIF